MDEIILNELLTMGEEEYKNFHCKLVPTVEKNRIIGIRVPKLRKYARDLKDYDDFLNALPHRYLEENNLHAFLLEREKDFDKCVKLLNEFLPFIDNWSTCDCLKPKALKKEPERLLGYIKAWLNSGILIRLDLPLIY